MMLSWGRKQKWITNLTEALINNETKEVWLEISEDKTKYLIVGDKNQEDSELNSCR